MTEPSKAVFLSYASQDAEAARRICEAVRAAGIEVWFDQSELRGGDAWDRQIRKHIHDCALFIPIISATTQGRTEGYFRREWKLAVDRTHDMADDTPFLLPVVIDDTPDDAARVPDKFREVQWSRLPGGEASAAFVERVARLLSPAPSPALAEGVRSPGAAAHHSAAAPRPRAPVLPHHGERHGRYSWSRRSPSSVSAISRWTSSSSPSALPQARRPPPRAAHLPRRQRPRPRRNRSRCCRSSTSPLTRNRSTSRMA